MRRMKFFIIVQILSLVVIFPVSGCGSIKPHVDTKSDDLLIESIITEEGNDNQLVDDKVIIQSSDRGVDNVILTLSKVPAINETVNLSLSVEVYNNETNLPDKVWIEFERYDPSLYYPLGRASDRDEALELLSALAKKSDPYSLQISRLFLQQPETMIDTGDVLVDGDLIWQGNPLVKGDKIQLRGNVRFQEEGEWLVSVLFQLEGSEPFVRTSTKITVNQFSGMQGWQENYQPIVADTILGEDNHFSVSLNITQAPALNENTEISCELFSIKNVEDVNITLTFTHLEDGGWHRNQLAAKEILIEGNSHWEGNLYQDTPVRFIVTVCFPETGDWEIGAYATSPNSMYDASSWIFCNVGNDQGRIGWAQSHEKDQDYPEETYQAKRGEAVK